MASSNQTPDVLFSPIAANADASDINTIPQTYDPANYGYAAQNIGFPTECRLPVLNPDGTLGQGRAPRMQDWNGIMKLVSSHNFFLQNGGSYTFNPTVSTAIGGYPKNTILWYFPENEAPCIVYSLINDNTNNFVNDPTLIDGTHWERLISPSSYADTDLSNLSATGEAHFANPALTNSPYTTNRILEIPQNVKVEINASNKLDLKAGSKIYYPNGFESDGVTPKFDVFTIESDLTSSNSHNGEHENFLLQPNHTTIFTLPDAVQFSGPTQPTGSFTYAIWYDTANNLVKTTSDGGSTWSSGLSLPFCRALGGTSDTITSIDQVFNGFGYIGSTVFALPMKGEATTAVNQNGTVTKTTWETTTVQTANVSAWWSSYSMSSAGVLTAGFNEVGYTKLADVTYYDSRIQNVNFYDIGFVANSNASNFSQAGRSYLAGIGMPSTRYEALTLGASGSTYVAPANGYFVLVKQASATGQYAAIYRAGNLMYSRPGASATASTWFGLWVPARKGDPITVLYTLGGSTQAFSFVYAEGEV